MKNNLLLVCLFFIAAYFLSGADIFREFMPRSVCMFRDQKLIWMHLISDSLIGVVYFGFGIGLVALYRSFNRKAMPYNDLFWKAGGFIFFCGITHVIGVINIYVTYYWVDGIFKLATACVSLFAFAAFVKSFKYLKNMATPAQYAALQKKLEEVIQILNLKST
jgi:two-component system NtrC family sensor kinase